MRPGMYGIGCDDIEFFVRCQKVIPTILEDDFQPAVRQGVVVDIGEQASAIDDRRFDLDKHDPFEVRMRENTPKSNTGAKPHHRRRFRIRVKEDW